jgi:DNA polymerase-1
MQKLLLIDGNAILHRAFHAYPDSFSDKKGNPTNAIYGFYAMLLKVIEEVKPDLLTICFDQGAPTFRMNLYAGYHANRPKMQDKLGAQVEPLRDSLKKIGIPVDAIDGYEADDLIGTLAFQAANEKGKMKNEKSLETIILTGDRDLLQLVNETTKVLMPITGITKSVLMDSAAVEDKYGIKPSQVIDYKALVGDPSDNYPGVGGVGPKTAAGLLQTYETLENIYTHLGDIKPELSTKLAQDAEQAMMCKNLATIHLDAPVHLDTKKSDVENFTPDKFLEVFEEFNIHSLARRLMQSQDTNSKKQETKDSIASLQNDKKKKEEKSPQLELL